MRSYKKPLFITGEKRSAIVDGSELGDVYGVTWGQMRGQRREKEKLGVATSMRISHAERSLKPHSLAVEIGSSSLNNDNIPLIGTLLACCQSPVVVDKEASTIRLIQFTPQEDFGAHPKLCGAAHSTIAETYLFPGS